MSSQARGGAGAKVVAVLEERIALMAPARRLRLGVADEVLTHYAGDRAIRVLDAGCGDGLLSLAIARRHPHWSLLGVDRRDDLLAGARVRARARSLDNVEFEPADLEKPMPESGFDAVLALECLSEIPDDERALRMMAAALAPGGLLAVQVPERDWRPVLPGSATTWREQVRQGYRAEGLTDALLRAGLVRVEIRPTFRTMVALAQDIRDRIRDSNLAIRLAAFPLLAVAVQLELWGVTGGRPNALFATARRPDTA